VLELDRSTGGALCSGVGRDGELVNSVSGSRTRIRMKKMSSFEPLMDQAMLKRKLKEEKEKENGSTAPRRRRVRSTRKKERKRSGRALKGGPSPDHLASNQMN
jgi:hypothetical protein